MAFNDHPYKTVKLTHNSSTKEYSQINVNGQTVWRKPISYTKMLYILDINHDYIVRSDDAVEDEGLEFHLYKLVNGNWIECLSPEDNDDLSNQGTIKYGDILKYTYTLNNGYRLYSNTSKMGTTDLVNNRQFVVTNNFSINIRIKPITYSLNLSMDAGVYSCTLTCYSGQAGTIQGYTVPRPVNSTATLFYRDRLELSRREINWGYAFKDMYISSGCDENNYVIGDVTVVVRSTVKTGVLNLSTSANGVASYSVYRQAGTIARREGKTDGNIYNGETLYTADKLTINAQAETGYELSETYPKTINLNNDNNLNVTEIITAVAQLYTLTINRTGKTINPVDNSSAITNVHIYREVDTISRREGYSDGVIYDGEITNNDEYVQVYYGDVLIINYTVQAPYKPLTQQVISVPAQDFSIPVNIEVKRFTVYITQNTGVASLTVTRTSSPYQEASTGVLSNEDIIFYGDVLTVEAVAENGYTLNGYSQSITVIGNTTIAPTTSMNVHHLYIENTAGINTVRIAVVTPGINPERLAGDVLYEGPCLNDSTIPYCNVYYGEYLQVLGYASTGYYVAQTHYQEVTGPYVTIYDEDALVSITTNPVERKFYLLGKEGITGIKLTCLSAGVGPHTVNEVLYDGNVKTDGNSYSAVYYNEIIKVEYYTHEAYNSLSPDTVTVLNENKTVTKNSTIKTYTLTSIKNTGVSNLLIRRTYRQYPSESSEEVILANGDSYNYGDTITVRATQSTGYILDSYTSEYTNVSSNLTISPTAHKIYGTLNIAFDIGVREVIVKRGSTTLSDGATIYYGDVLTISASSKPGYSLVEYTSTRTFTPSTDGETLTVSISSTINQYTLNVTYTSGVNSYTVRRTSSPIGGGSTGIIQNGDTIYYNDTLSIVYNSSTNYVVGSGYATSETLTITCTTFSDGKFNYKLTATETAPLVISQYAISGSSLDNEDRITLKINYPDNIGTAINYDPNKRIRLNDKARLYLSEQNYNDNLPSISKVGRVHTLFGDEFEESLINGEYYEISCTSSTNSTGSNYKVYFEPYETYLRITIRSNEVKYLNPATATVIVYKPTSKYKGNTYSSTFSLADRTYHSSGDVTEGSVKIYYKDEFKIYSADVTGWSFRNISLIYFEGSLQRSDTIANNTSVTVLGDSYEATINRDINTYNLTFMNTNAIFQNAYLNEQEVINNWSAYNSSSDRSFTASYGSKFRKNATTPANNDPMPVNNITHNNQVDYYLTNNIAVIHSYNSRLVPPRLGVSFTLGNNSYGEETATFFIMASTDNNSSGYPYTIKLTMYIDGLGKVLERDLTINSSGPATITFTCGLGDIGSTYPMVYVYAYVVGKTLGLMNRARSEETCLEVDLNGNSEETTTTEES